jgi:hypothetical protein
LATEDAIFKLTHEVSNALNSTAMVGSIFYDLEKKTCDTVNHTLLIKKLPYCGITGKSKLLIESCLSNRYQRVQLDNLIQNSNAVSRWTKVKHGIPQGSVLSPLLFLLYINDLPIAVTHNAIAILFTDDTRLLITSQNVHEFQNKFNTSFQQISKWFQVNSLSLKLSKAFFIQFSNKSPNYFDINITHENNYIPKVNDMKFLGLNINHTLSWKTHIDNILPKLCSACFAMRSVKLHVSHQMLKVTYYSYFHFIMSYGIIFWGTFCN